MGAIGLVMNRPPVGRARLPGDYPPWNREYATEAAREMLRYGFEQLEPNRIFASTQVRNPASGE